MRKSLLLLLCVLNLSLNQTALGQTPAPASNHFAANGLSFDYPKVVSLNDQSTDRGNHLIMQMPGTAQIMIMSRFDKLASPEALADARREVFDAFVESIWQELKKMDPNVSRVPSEIEIAGTKASGIRMRAVLDTESGNAEVYSIPMGGRLVLLTLIGSDKELAASSPAWLMIRRSLKVNDSAAPTTAVDTSTLSNGRKTFNPLLRSGL
jgi:hypothetical protein